MTYHDPAATKVRRFPTVQLAGLLVAFAALAAGPGHELLSHPADASGDALRAAPVEIVLRPERRGGLSDADGLLPGPVTPLDNAHQAVTNLDPALLRALRKAAEDAARDGVELLITSGWRSFEYQQELFRQAVAERGSESEAALWVANPGTSAHESGDAVDIGPAAAEAWLSRHGQVHGLCQIYRNEPWHFELRVAAISDGCPRPYRDASQNPGTQR